MFCSQCGSPSNASAKLCAGCGAALQAGLAPIIQDNTDTQDDQLKAVIGCKSQSYYLSHFQRFNHDKKMSASWNWSAFFLTFHWMLYRKMWLAALIYFFLPHALTLPAIALSAAAGEYGILAVGVIYALYFIGVFILVPMYANALYYRHCNIKIAEVKASTNEQQRQLDELAAKGGTSSIILIVALIFIFVAIIGVFIVIAIPAYQNFTTRANLNSALSSGNTATEVVANFYYQHQMFPSNLESNDFVVTLPESIRSLELSSENGIISITMATTPIAGQSLQLVPSFEEGGQINWQCMSEEIDNKYLPLHCRQ